MVAPSLVTVMSPSGEIRILSRPRGPREVRTIPATVFAARMCDLTASLPCCLFFLPWSLTIMKGRPFSSFATWAEGGSCVSLVWQERLARQIGKYRWTYQVLSNMSARRTIKLFGDSAYAWPWRAVVAAPEERWRRKKKPGGIAGEQRKERVLVLLPCSVGG